MQQQQQQQPQPKQQQQLSLLSIQLCNDCVLGVSACVFVICSIPSVYDPQNVQYAVRS